MSNETFAPETAVIIDLGITKKPGHVVEDQGGDTIHVRYETAKGESFKDVKRAKISLPVAADEVPVRDVNDEETDLTAVEVDGTVVAITSHFDLAEETSAKTEKSARKAKAAATPAPVDPASAPQLSTDDVRGICKRVVAECGPRQVLAGTRVVAEWADLNETDRARVEVELHYQAGRVLQFLDQEVPEGWGVNRERRTPGTRPANVRRVARL